ncbi:unnamed protein product [Rotaria sp. Silwood2]|nr:unnamed protein product [Rotaria sp. Silwood2]CAF4028847.1 unnamed protein product [Rotaria sp. Silwood2]CAF4445266.1 unnamed protein product [Rotaria sp. Silwood2]
MKYLVFYCSFVILAFYVLSVLSIKCYVCKEPDRKCRDPFHNDTIFLKDCSQIGMGNATMCRKYMWENGRGINSPAGHLTHDQLSFSTLTAN